MPIPALMEPASVQKLEIAAARHEQDRHKHGATGYEDDAHKTDEALAEAGEGELISFCRSLANLTLFFR